MAEAAKGVPAEEVAAKIEALMAADGYGSRRVLTTVIDCG